MPSGRLRALRNWTAEAWPLLQGTAAATVAWVVANELETDHEPFFAPIAAFVALNAPLGERGLNAVRLVLGVVVGIVAGEVTVATLGGGYERMALATFVAAAVARTLGGSRIVIAQAANGAILTVALARGQAGVDRLLDALIGAGVALVFSQLLFSPEPVAMLRRAEATALDGITDGLELTAQALERADDELAERAVSRLRDVRDGLAELGRVTRVSSRVARRSVIWRSQEAPAVRETENAGHLDLLAGSCLMFTRTASAASASGRRWLAPSARELVRALADLARDPGDRAARQRAADRALDVARRLAEPDAPSDVTTAGAIGTGRTMAADVMTFAGVERQEAVDAVREGTGQFQVPAPPETPRARLRSARPRLRSTTAWASLAAALAATLRRWRR